MADVYVKTEALSAWKTDMEKINKLCLENIESIMSSMGDLNSSFQGDYAEKFESTFDSYTKKVKSSHEDLVDIEKFLNKVIEVMNNQ